MIGDGMRLAVAALVLVGCADEGGFELRVHVTASGLDAVQGTSGERDLSFEFKSAAAAVATPPTIVVTDGAGPHTFAIAFDCSFVAFDCSFMGAHEDPVEVDVIAQLWRDGTTLALSPYTHGCLYSNGIQVYETP